MLHGKFQKKTELVSKTQAGFSGGFLQNPSGFHKIASGFLNPVSGFFKTVAGFIVVF